MVESTAETANMKLEEDDNDLFSSLPTESLLSTNKDSVDDNANEDLFAECLTDPAVSNVSTDGNVVTSLVENKLAADTKAEAAGDPSASLEFIDDLSQHIEILVSDPKKIGDGMGAYVAYKVITRTNIKHFKSCEMFAIRRFSDFFSLHEKLVSKYQSRGIIVPPPPEKSVIGMTKVKITKEDTGPSDFVEKRRAALERFINRIAKHPTLCADNDFIDFVELDGELPKSGAASALSGAGFVRLLNRVGDSIGKMTYTMVETDETAEFNQWFEDKVEQIDMMDREFQLLHASVELLVLNRKDLAQSTEHFAKSVALLGSAEDHMSLSRALSQLSEVEMKITQLHADQADADFFVLSELIKDYITVVQAIKDVFNERVKLHKTWKDAELLLGKKQEERTKFEQQYKADKVAAVSVEITELELKVRNGQREFDEISDTIRKELARFDHQRVRDFRATIINYLQCMLNYQQQIVTCWELFLPEAKDVA